MARTGTITGVVGAMALAAALLGSGPAGPAVGAAPAPAAPTLTTNTTVLELGTDLVVSGTGCLDSGGSATDHIVAIGLADPELPYQLEVPPVSLGQTQVEADGSWSIATAVAQPLPPAAGCWWPDVWTSGASDRSSSPTTPRR